MAAEEEEANFRWSECGVDFDEYIRRRYHPLGCGPASRDVPDLWPGRRCRLYDRDGKPREASVDGWSQWARDPGSYRSKWSLRLIFDAPGVGDDVTIRGLHSARQYNGMRGVALRYDNAQGRFAVRVAIEGEGGAEKKRLAVKPENLSRPTQELYVKRMNVEGGGVLHALGVRVIFPLLSLEWLGPATPAIDLDDEITVPSCPSCRAIEPAIAAFQEADLTSNEEECPVCLERKACRRLRSCSHVVCEGCWTEWRRATSTSVPELLTEDRPAAVTAVDSGAESKATAEEDVASERIDLLKHLVTDANGGEEGLRRFRDRVARTTVADLLVDCVRRTLLRAVPIPALEIFLHVLEGRLDEISHLNPREEWSGSSVDPADFFFNDVALVCCTHIGEQYERMLSFRGAIPWYERALLYARRISNERSRKSCVLRTTCNLGLAQKHSSFLLEAQKTYRAALEVDPTNTHVLHNQEVLEEEMKVWTGSSGKLTPGC